MKTAILFGNGINRSCGAKSWDELLKDIAKRFYVGKDNAFSPTIEFEKIANQVLAQNRGLSADSFCFDVVKNVDDISGDYIAVYKKYFDIPFDLILTTNYDYAIERTIIDGFTFEENKSNIKLFQETKCSNRRHTILNGKMIYHIHGELGKPSSICLGTVHYVTNLSKIIDAITEKDEAGGVRIKGFPGGDHDLCSWAESFFTHDIYIVGLGLWDCDIDLWWLITFRAQLIASGTAITNRIVYYHLYTKGNRNMSLIECLRVFCVEVREVEVEDDKWYEEYLRIAEDISSNMN